jgi:hypothetical protein
MEISFLFGYDNKKEVYLFIRKSNKSKIIIRKYSPRLFAGVQMLFLTFKNWSQ